LERCIHPGQDVLLPSLNDAEQVGTFFIVACTDANGFSIIARRIRTALQDFSASKVKPAISSMTVLLAAGQSREGQIGEVTTQIELLVQTHLVGKTKLK
jgi:hypothetical protein